MDVAPLGSTVPVPPAPARPDAPAPVPSGQGGRLRRWLVAMVVSTTLLLTAGAVLGGHAAARTVGPVRGLALGGEPTPALQVVDDNREMLAQAVLWHGQRTGGATARAAEAGSQDGPDAGAGGTGSGDAGATSAQDGPVGDGAAGNAVAPTAGTAEPIGAGTAVAPATGPAAGTTTHGAVSGDHGAPERQVDCAVAACVALTFDDGPGPDTERLLDLLGWADAKATFFVLGQRVAAYPQTIQRMQADGHEIGGHSYRHQNLTTLSPAEIEWNVTATAELVEYLTGTGPALLRPPYGAVNDTVRQHAGVPLITWDVDTLDWRSRDAGTTVHGALDAVRPGSILLMHDIYPSTVDALPAVVDGLRDRGLTLVTVSELSAGQDLTPGHTYSRRD